MRDVIKFLKKIFMKPTETENTKAMKNAYKQALYSLKNIPTEQIKERYLPELVFKTLEFLVQYFDEHPDRVSTDTERNLLKDLREQLTEYRHNQVNILDILEKLKSNLAKIEPGFFNRGYVYPTFDLTLALPSFHTQNLMKKMIKVLGQENVLLKNEKKEFRREQAQSVNIELSEGDTDSQVSENLFSDDHPTTNRKQKQTAAKEKKQATEKNASSVASFNKDKPNETQQEGKKKSKVVSIAYVPPTARNRTEKTKQQEQSHVTNIKQAGLFKNVSAQSQQKEQSAPNPF